MVLLFMKLCKNLFSTSVLLGLLLSLTVSHFASAQSNTSTGSLEVTLNHIAIYVYDLEKSTAFYEDVLQIKKIPEPFNDGKHTWFSIGTNSQLHLIEGAAEITEHDKNSHLCFSVKSVDDFITTLDRFGIDRINWAGDSKEPTVRVDGIKQIYFQDPDGYWIEVNDDFPGRAR